MKLNKKKPNISKINQRKCTYKFKYCHIICIIPIIFLVCSILSLTTYFLILKYMSYQNYKIGL